MACKRGVYCNLSALSVSYLSYHDNVRVLPQYMTQGSCKWYAYLGVHLNLVYYLEMILYGVFNGHNVLIHGIYHVQYSIGGCCLAAACGTCEEYHAKGLFNHLLQY